MNNITSILYWFNVFESLNTIIPLPWQRLIPEWCDRNYRNAWIATEYCSLFIGTGRSLWGITSMPLMKTYNIDSDIYGLKGHSIFKSVCNAEAFTKRNLRLSYTNSFIRGSLLSTRPSATKHGPNTLQILVCQSHSC